MNAFSEIPDEAVARTCAAQLWAHSMTVAVLAKQICHVEKAAPTVAQAAFTAGLLHDIGRLLLLTNLPGRMKEVDWLAQVQSLPSWGAERAVFGTSHAEVGAYLVGLWGLPDPIVEAVAFHHSPARSRSKEFLPLTAVHAAAAFAEEMRDHAETKSAVRRLDEEYLALLGLREHAANWQVLCQVTIEEKLGPELQHL